MAKRVEAVKRKRFRVTVATTCEVDLHPSLLPDDEWRSQFYDLRSLSDVARHVVYNHVVNELNLSDLDGFADRDNAMAIVQVIDTDAEAEPLTAAKRKRK